MKEKVLSRNFVTVMAANMLYVFGFYMLMPTIPLFIKSLGGSEAQVGIVAASFTIAAIVMRFFAPFLLTRLTKRSMLRLGVALSIIVTATCGLSANVPAAMGFRILQGLGFGIVSTICGALAADLLPDSRRGEGIGYFGMGTTAMVAFSPAIGLSLSQTSGFGVMFLVAAAGQLCSLICLAVFSPPADINKKSPPVKSISSLLRNLFEPALALQITLLVLFGICRSAEQNFLSLLAGERGIALASYFIFQTAVSFVSKFVTGKLYDKHGPSGAVLIGGGSLFLALSIMSLAETLPVLLIAGFFSGAGMGALLPAMQSWTMTSLGASRRSAASAIYYNYYDIGISAGSVIFGYLVGFIGYAWTFRTASFVMIAFLAVFLSAMQIKRKSGARL